MADAPPRSPMINATVDRLLGYLPFTASAGNLYEEHVPTGNRFDHPTKALDYLQKLSCDPSVQLIVLTGNAGHGKTHICRRLLEGYGVENAMDLLKADLTGKRSYQGSTRSGRGIRIIKDLSEIPPAHDAPALLRSMLEDPAAVGIVCANEGKLREVASRDTRHLGVLIEGLEKSVEIGRTTTDGRVHVLNLNYQSVAPRTDGFLEHALSYFADGRRWTACQSCSAAERCPIYENRSRLVGSKQADSEARATRAALVQLVRIAEQTGQVVTFREALILVAFLITGARSCADVHRDMARPDSDRFGLEALLFKRDLTAEQREQLALIERIRRLDPGRASIRSIDERLHDELEQRSQLGDEVLVSARPPARTRRELNEERETHQELIRAARRRDFFVHVPAGGAGEEERARRLGFQHYREFELLFEDNADQTHMIDVLERVIAGLHAVQGVRSAIRQSLCIVDPAFAREGNRSAVVARTFPQKRLELLSESKFWRQLDCVGPPTIPESCDWIDRRVVLVHHDRSCLTPLLAMDLFQFEFIVRAGRGVVFSQFHAADRRRLLARLAKHAEERIADTDEIQIVDGRARKMISVERDGRIEVVEGA